VPIDCNIIKLQSCPLPIREAETMAIRLLETLAIRIPVALNLSVEDLRVELSAFLWLMKE